MEGLANLLQLEAEVIEAAGHHEMLVAARPGQLDPRGATDRITPHEIVGNGGSLDSGAGDSVAIREVTQTSSDRAPAPRHRPSAYSRLLAVGRVFVDHQVERHDPGDQIDELLLPLAAGMGKLVGELRFE